MLRPFGPPRDAQRYAHFVRVAALPISHKMCIALVAPAAGVMVPGRKNGCLCQRVIYSSVLARSIRFSAVIKSSSFVPGAFVQVRRNRGKSATVTWSANKRIIGWGKLEVLSSFLRSFGAFGARRYFGARQP